MPTLNSAPPLKTFIAIFHGYDGQDARIVATLRDADTIQLVARRALSDPQNRLEDLTDPVLKELSRGRRRALETILAGGA